MRHTILVVMAALTCAGCTRITDRGFEIGPLAAASDLAETQAELMKEKEQRVEADTNLGNHLASEVTLVREDLSGAIQTAVAEQDPTKALADLAAKLGTTNSRLETMAAEASTLSDEQLAQLQKWLEGQDLGRGGDNTLLYVILTALGLGTGESIRRSGAAKKAAEKSTPPVAA